MFMTDAEVRAELNAMRCFDELCEKRDKLYSELTILEGEYEGFLRAPQWTYVDDDGNEYLDVEWEDMQAWYLSNIDDLKAQIDRVERELW